MLDGMLTSIILTENLNIQNILWFQILGSVALIIHF